MTNSRILADHNDDNDVIISAYAFRDKGKSIKLAEWMIKFSLIKNKKVKAIRPPGMQDTWLDFENCEVHPRISFLDYVFGGTEICLQIAVDMTLSNKKVAKPDSLHYIN
jgi:hypothetical protein